MGLAILLYPPGYLGWAPSRLFFSRAIHQAPSGLFGPGYCSFRVIWAGCHPARFFSTVSRATAPSGLFFSRATLRVIWAWLLYPPGYLGWALSTGPPSGLFGPGYFTVPSGLFGLGTLRVIFQPSHPPGPLRVIWAWLLYLPGYLGRVPSSQVLWGFFGDQ